MAEPLHPYPLAFERHPTLRQSLLAKVDQCPLSARLELEFERGWSSHLAAMGIIFHRFAAKCVMEMHRQDEDHIDPDSAQAIMSETLHQADEDELVAITAEHIADLRWMAPKFALDFQVDIASLVDVEQTLSTDVRYVTEHGEPVTRRITGKLDALLIENANGIPASHAIVPDYKAQPVDAKVLTPSGWRRVGDLVKGDRVIGVDGRPTEVVGVYPQGRKQVFAVAFTDGSQTECCEDHLWCVQRPGGSGRRVWSLRDVLADRSRDPWRVPAVQPVEFDPLSEPLPVDPYLLGVLLGDGTLRANGSIAITSVDPEVVERAGAALPAGVTCRQECSRGVTWSLTASEGRPRGTQPNPLRRALAAMGLVGARAWEKHVPKPYLHAPPDDRLKLLRGLMDTDGCANVNGRVSFVSSSRALAEDVRFLVWSLGGHATIKTYPQGGHRDAHTVFIRLGMPPFSLSRKVANWRPPRASMTRGIRSAAPVGEKECVCIRVAAQDGLYVTDDFIVTHNSGWGLPPEKQISDSGYFQQRVYGLLVLANYPSVRQVTLREWYARRSEVREGHIGRDQLELLREEVAALAHRFDRMAQAAYSREQRIKGGEQDVPAPRRAFGAAPGSHCAYCAAPGLCPIYKEARREGMIESPEEAAVVAEELIVAKAQVKRRQDALRAWTAAHGPTPIRNSKDADRRWGPVESLRNEKPTQEQVEEALAQGRNPAELYRQVKTVRYQDHSPRQRNAA